MAVIKMDRGAPTHAPGQLIRRVNKAMTGLIDARFDAACGMSFVQWIALKSIEEGTVGTAGELAREMSLSTGATTRLIDQLEERGMLARQRKSDDRRVVSLEVLPYGCRTIGDLQPIAIDTWNLVLGGFGQTEFEMIEHALSRLAAAIERATTADIAKEKVA